ncbi:MAG: PadR family transcriptional regulator [Dehalococcoidales bacterium]|nr:PadR family transcriptional regulator [Dehalococcoidales bacterium]
MVKENTERQRTFITDPEVPLKGIISIVIIHFIQEKPMHGGEIYQRMKETYQLTPPRGIMYGILRKMEGEGLITSYWDIQESGPARRMYRITDEGIEYSRIGIERVKKTIRVIHLLLENQKLQN